MSPKWSINIALFQRIAKVIETHHIVLQHCKQCFKTIRRVSITLAMFWNYATCLYHLGDVLNQCDMFLSFWPCFETMWCVSITLLIFLNNASHFNHLGDVLKQCDAFLSLKLTAHLFAFVFVDDLVENTWLFC